MVGEMEQQQKRFCYPSLLAEDELDINSLVESVRKKVLAQAHEMQLKPRTDSAFLLKFLRVKKYKVDETVDRIREYYRQIFRHLNILEGIWCTDHSKPLNQRIVSYLKCSINESAVIYFNVKHWVAKELTFRQIQLGALFLVEELLTYKEIQLNGITLICNVNGFGFSHLRDLNVFEVKDCIQILMMGLPGRVIGIHAVNLPRLARPLLSVVTKLLPEKVRNRIHIHENMESIHKFVHPAKLPGSLGGELSENDAVDETFTNSLINSNPKFESYWSPEIIHRPKRLNKKRSSLTCGLLTSEEYIEVQA